MNLRQKFELKFLLINTNVELKLLLMQNMNGHFSKSLEAMKKSSRNLESETHI